MGNALRLMGNALRLICCNCCEPPTTGCSVVAAPCSGGLDVLQLGSQVPEGLDEHVASSREAQAVWYKKLLDAWREAEDPPETPEDESRFVIQTLKGHQKADVEVLLWFYGLPPPHALVQLSSGVPTSMLEGVKDEMHTLPVGKNISLDDEDITNTANNSPQGTGMPYATPREKEAEDSSAQGTDVP